MKNILITGRPGVGKTTLIQRIVEAFRGSAGGFFTREIRQGERRTGFQLVTLRGEAGLLSSTQIQSSLRVGKYRVLLKDLEELGVRAVDEAVEKHDLVVVDEIGKMELFSEKFRTAVLNALEAPKWFLATIMQGRHPFVDKIRSRADIELIEVTQKNRDALVGEILNRLNQTVR